MIWFRKLHRWIGLAIGIQVGVWMLSGLMMGLLDHERVQGREYQAVRMTGPVSASIEGLLEAGDIVESVSTSALVSNITLTSHLDTAVYRVVTPGKVRLYDANTGARLVVTADDAAAIAQRDYAGPGTIVAVTPVRAPAIEIRRHSGDAWRVDFDDDEATTLYVAADDGRILERRNATWRLFDVFWMLHIMDYRGREDFNNALVILVSLIAAWFSVTGVVLFFDSFRRDDFLGLVPVHWWREPARITVCAPHGEVVARVDAHANGRLYEALAAENIVLPSNCGGGGTCGLCQVQLAADAPESAADRRLISEPARRRGMRLSCQAKVARTMTVNVSDAVLSAEMTNATVIASRRVTPFIREIRLNVGSEHFEYPAGSYVHVVIPPYRIRYATIDLSPELRAALLVRQLPLESVSTTEIRRAYSLATPCEDEPGTIVLNVRFLPPPEGHPGAAAGVGSTYMWSLRPGDRLSIVGPLGDFVAQDSDRPMMLIGGGAGMAPLRAIIRSELLHKRSGRQIEFWYGARTTADSCYVAEFDELQRRHANFSWQQVLSEPLGTDDWNGPVGLVHKRAGRDLLAQHRDLLTCEYYVCGPPPMLAATRYMLAELSVLEDQVFFDDFGI